MNQRVVGLNSRQLDDLNNEIGQPRRLDTHPAREPSNGGRVVGCILDRLGQQRNRADRCLELVADVGNEVATGLLDPLSRRLVVGQDEHQALVKGRDPSGQICGGDANAAVDLEVNDAAIAFAPNAADQLEQPEPQPSASYQAKGPRGRRRLEYLVVRADHHAGGWQYREHLRHTSRNHWLRDIEGRTRPFVVSEGRPT